MRPLSIFILILCLAAAGARSLHAETAAGINLLWEAETVTPPNYLGKALPSGGSPVRIIALPYGPNQGGLPLQSADFTYRWSKDGLNLPDSSGAGKNLFSYNAAGTGSNTVELVAESKINKLSFTKRITIPVEAPKVLWYEADPLWGILYNQTLPATYRLVKPELGVAAVPYFFDAAADRAGQVSYSWNLNQKPIAADPGHANIVTFLKPNNYVRGDNNVEVVLKNSRSALQNAKNSLRITFNQ